MKKRIKRKLRKWGRRLLKNIICLIVGVVYAIYLLVRGFNNMIASLFMKLPRVTRVSIIYLLILGTGLALKHSFKNVNFEVKTNILQKVGVPVVAEVKEECTLGETACKIKEVAEEYNIDWKVAVSISAWETGHWTSSLYFNNNNVGGLYRNGSFMKFDTLEQGIDAFVSNLKYNYFDLGLNTLDLIKPKYCPDNDVKDTGCVNQYWLNGTKKIYESLEG